MHPDFVKVGLERNRLAETEIVRFGSGLLRKLAEIPLGVEGAERSAADSSGVRDIDRPDVDVFLLCAFDRGIDIRIRQAGTSAEIIDPGREQDYGLAFPGSWPALHPILQGKIGTCEGPAIAQR